MPRRSALPLAGLAAVALAGCGAAAAQHPAAGPPGTCADQAAGELRAIALRIYRSSSSGPNVLSARARLARSPQLAAAVARGDATAARAALLPLLKHQIQRISITHDGRPLVAAGRARPLTPVRGTIVGPDGRVAGAYVLGVSSIGSYPGITAGLTGGQVVVRARGRIVASSLTRPPAHPPGSGTARFGGRTERVVSFTGRAWPDGPLRVSVLLPPRALRACGSSSGATRMAVVAAAARRLYRAEQQGTGPRAALRYAAADARFRAAVRAGDGAAIRRAIVGFFHVRRLHMVRVRATQAGRLLNDTGGPYVLAPASAPLPGPGGRPATVTLAIQDDTGYIKLVRRLLGARAVLRTAAGQVPGSAIRPPAGRLPATGVVTVNGRRWRVASFTGERFPSGPLRISILRPA